MENKDNLLKHCRYKIWCDYYGLFDDRRVIAFADNIDDCVFIINALKKSYDGRPFTFTYELIDDFDVSKDVLTDDLLGFCFL